MTIQINECEFCAGPVPDTEEHCPHCHRPSLFPNVVAASRPNEIHALDARYQTAVKEAKMRGVDGVLTDFEHAVGEKSKAVMARNEGALTLCLYGLDRLISDTTRREAIGELGRLMEDPWIAERLRSVMYSAPLPEEADAQRVSALAAEAPPVVQSFYADLIAHREDICRVAAAFDAVEWAKLGGEVSRREVAGLAVRRELESVHLPLESPVPDELEARYVTMEGPRQSDEWLIDQEERLVLRAMALAA